jgi:hypothetical protein
MNFRTRLGKIYLLKLSAQNVMTLRVRFFEPTFSDPHLHPEMLRLLTQSKVQNQSQKFRSLFTVIRFLTHNRPMMNHVFFVMTGFAVDKNTNV